MKKQEFAVVLNYSSGEVHIVATHTRRSESIESFLTKALEISNLNNCHYMILNSVPEINYVNC